jgi:hypothetical protein
VPHALGSTLTEEGYLPRIIGSRIDDLLDTFGAVCIEGSK